VVRKLGGLGLGDITRGLENFANPSAAGFLESLGPTTKGTASKGCAGYPPESVAGFG